jgi:hypothetical protein
MVAGRPRTIRQSGGIMDKLRIGSELRSMIAYYTELTINEHMSQDINPEADEAWRDIEKLIKQLVEA